MSNNERDAYKLHADTVNAAKQTFIMSFIYEINTHKYDSRSLIIGALNTHLDELKEKEKKL